MSIERIDFDAIGIADLQALLNNQIPEGQRLDYKQALYGAGVDESLECMKDASSFANTHGGHLIIGISEENDIPTAINGVAVTDPDAEIRRIEQRLETGVEPSIQGVRIKNIQLANGNCCFVIRIPRSWRPPHRVVAQGKNRFYMRNSRAVYEPDVEGLRMLFTAGSDIAQKVRQFKKERLEQITIGNGTRPLQGTGRMLLHIIPFASLSSDIQIDLEAVHEFNNRLPPIASTTGWSPRFNFDGFVNERGGDINFGYTQVFRNGIIEAARANVAISNERFPQPRIFAPDFEGSILGSLSSYIGVLRDLQVPPPFAVALTLEGVRGATYRVGSGNDYGFDDEPPPIENDPLFLPECIINAYGTDAEYHQALKPAFDALWNSAGKPAARWFNGPGGAWQRPPRL